MSVTLPHNIVATDPREIEPIMANFTTLADKFSGNIGTADLTDLAISTAKIADTAVTEAKIGAAAVTTAKIADANVTTSKIVDGNVTTAKIADLGVTADKIAANAVGLAKLGTDVFSFNNVISVDTTATVAADVNTFTNIGPTLLTYTPTSNCYLLVSGYVTLKHNAASGTPSLRVGIRNTSTNTVAIGGALGSRSIESANAHVPLPIGGMITMVAGTTYTLSLMVSSSVSGTVSLVSASQVSAIAIPR